MSDEFISNGYGDSLQFTFINSEYSAEGVTGLTSLCDFPVFQDKAGVDAWGQHEGAKDDMYVYGADGLLSAYLPASGALSTNLRTSEGFQNLKDAILQAVGN